NRSGGDPRCRFTPGPGGTACARPGPAAGPAGTAQRPGPRAALRTGRASGRTAAPHARPPSPVPRQQDRHAAPARRPGAALAGRFMQACRPRRPTMRVKEVMTPGVECIPPDSTLQDAARKMQVLDVGPLPVCDHDRLAGMLTDRDIVVRAVAEGRDPGT